MSVEISEYVPNEKLERLVELLNCCGGRFTCNHVDGKQRTWVSYEVEDYERFSKAWARANTQIVERRKDVLWRRIFRRLGISV